MPSYAPLPSKKGNQTWPDHLVGIGIYTVPEAARLTGVSVGRIHRWLQGYEFRVSGRVHTSPPVLKADLAPLGGVSALSFRDLVEVRFVDYFLRKGVTWPTLRLAAAHAAEIIGSSHPFSTKRFKTNGNRIFGKLGTQQLLEVSHLQYTIPEIIEPQLYSGLEFAHLEVVRWFPMDPNRQVVIDPQVAFGRPTIAREGIPTETL